MNIFILDDDIDKCAEYHVDKHIVKMPLEAAQMLCTNHWINKYLGHIPRKLESHEWQVIKEAKTNKVRDFPYLPTMYNHPCTIWARQSLDNYEWLYCYALALNDEYGYRYGKSHKSVQEVVLRLPDPVQLPRTGLTQFVMAMPDDLKSENPIQSYRQFYHKDKATFASWKGRNKPDWWLEEEADYESRITR
jgi:hypothetical protein|tara:strand:- start:3169 stop:3741 length:573 start_codon:yes stop_codon:yes gene_type:complete